MYSVGSAIRNIAPLPALNAKPTAVHRSSSCSATNGMRFATPSNRRSHSTTVPKSRESPMKCALSAAGHPQCECMNASTMVARANVLTSQA